MRKRDRNETEEERKARKRAKKEAKKKDKERNEKEKQSRDSLSSIKAEPPTPRAPKAQDEDVMVDERPGHFQQKRVRMIVSVFPSALRDLKRHINESLQNLLLRYVDGLDGVLLAFDSVAIGGKDSPHGMILNEQPQVHCSVEFDALLFCPTIGSKVRSIHYGNGDKRRLASLLKFFGSSVVWLTSVSRLTLECSSTISSMPSCRQSIWKRRATATIATPSNGSRVKLSWRTKTRWNSQPSSCTSAPESYRWKAPIPPSPIPQRK